MKRIIFFNKVHNGDVALVGGKNASLGEMTQHLVKLGIDVPAGFATTVTAYHEFLDRNNLSEKIYKILDKLDPSQIKQLKATGATIRRWIMNAELSSAFANEVMAAYKKLHQSSVAVRSSATCEDLPEASFAGQQETYLNVRGRRQVLEAVKKVFASLFTDRAIKYRVDHGFPHEKVGISAGIQIMVRSDKAASGVMFTIDTESGFDKIVMINAAYGLGETIVQGSVNPDEFYVYKPFLQKNKDAILHRKLGSKAVKMVYAINAKKPIKSVAVSAKQQQHFCISDKDITGLAKKALLIEKHYGVPMDIEWAKDGVTGKLYIVQARPETVKSQDKKDYYERFKLQEKSKLVITGQSIGQRIGQGKARVVKNPRTMEAIKAGEVLITDMTDPDWEPIMKKAAAIVTNRGGRTCHAAIIARELGIPAVVGCTNATKRIKNGEKVTVSCAEGEIGNVYQGLLKYQVDKISFKKLPELPVSLCMNLGNPDQAFSLQSLPNNGIGLARLEFIINHLIGVHPNALLDFKKLSPVLKKKIAVMIAAYSSPKEYYIEKLKEGIATIAAAFYPKQVIFRFSDFKSNEYANLLGGKEYEPNEENPMLGFRGASRYVAESFKGCFALECEAFRRVRDDMGLVNAQVMVPFVRTVNEIKNVISLMKANGLARGKNKLKIYMMCEIPSNIILAEEFLKYVDGYSIGSNDLTQLTLGLDRDSELVSYLFDERNAAVKTLLSNVISVCRKNNKYVGICGQAPSDYPELAKWLVEQGIDSISLSPDTIVELWLSLSKRFR